MSKLWRMFLLFSQHALEYKSRSFVWFLATLFEVLVYFLFWRGALKTGTTSIPWDASQVLSYYLLLIVAGTFLHVHIEEEVAFEDIQYGRLSQYLTRPFSYLMFKFLQELPYRIIQGLFGAAILIGAAFVYPQLRLVPDTGTIPFVIALILGGYMLSFLYKMTIGVLAFWTTDFSGLANMETLLFMLFGGFLVPLHFLPPGIREVSLVSPLAFILYVPILAVEGVLAPLELWRALVMQGGWAVMFLVLFRYLWNRGLQRFSAVGL